MGTDIQPQYHALLAMPQAMLCQDVPRLRAAATAAVFFTATTSQFDLHPSQMSQHWLRSMRKQGPFQFLHPFVAVGVRLQFVW